MSDNRVIPFNALGRSVNQNRSEINDAISRVLDSGWFVMGPEHDHFESELASFIGVEHALGVANGTDALELALTAAGVNQNSQVITVANAGAYATTAIRLMGAEPIYCDVDPHTLLMTPKTLQATFDLLPEKPQAIVVTHLYGALAPIQELTELAHRHNVLVIEDCAQSLGATISGKRGGSFGDLATTSFYPTKNLGALGDGGAVMTNNAEYAQTIRKCRQYGWTSKYHIGESHGRNSRLDEMQAAILRLRLTTLDTNNERRRQIHRMYESADSVHAKLVNTSNQAFIGHLAVAVTDSRAKVRSDLEARGITTEVHYPIPDNKQGFPDFDPRKIPLDVTEWASQAVFSIPLFPELTEDEIFRVQQAINDLR